MYYVIWLAASCNPSKEVGHPPAVVSSALFRGTGRRQASQSDSANRFHCPRCWCHFQNRFPTPIGTIRLDSRARDKVLCKKWKQGMQNRRENTLWWL